MPRTWGYIIVALAAFVGAGALLLPMPEQVEVEQIEAPPPPASKPPRPAAAPAASRAAKKPPTPPPPPPPTAKPPEAAPPSPRPFPMQDTTKTRTMVQPKPADN